MAANLTGGLTELDDYAACRIEREEDWRDPEVVNDFETPSWRI
jgi:hypothetical protein